MRIRNDDGFTSSEAGGFDAEYIDSSIEELERMRDTGEIEAHAYLTKKNALVKLFLKATTNPLRQRKNYETEL